MNNFTNDHRYLVQYFMKKGMVKVVNALNFCTKRNPDANMTTMETIIMEINREIGKQSFKIAKAVCEITQDEVYMWLNTKNDDISKLQVGFSAIELEYFHTILKEIVSSEEHRITYPVCINLTSTLTANFSRDKGEKALNKWMSGGYYVKKGAHVYFGPRCLAEFTSYLRAHTQDCVCKLCSELVFIGGLCHACEKPFHTLCLEKYFSRDNSTCPHCKADWDEMPLAITQAPRENHNDAPSQKEEHNDTPSEGEDDHDVQSQSGEPVAGPSRNKRRK